MPYNFKDVFSMTGALIGWFKKPRLRIEFSLPEDLREWDLLGGGRKQKVATVHVRNNRRATAERCVAVLKLISAPPGVTVEEKEFVLHWADTDYKAHTNIAEPVDIGIERRRLDMVFTVSVEGRPPTVGAWVAIPLALSAPFLANQAYLPPGEYRFRLAVECANGKGASKEFLISSPPFWSGLSARSV